MGGRRHHRTESFRRGSAAVGYEYGSQTFGQQKQEQGTQTGSRSNGKERQRKEAEDGTEQGLAQKLLTLEGPDSNRLMKKPSKVSIAEDPNASEVFKSLFTTCEKALNQTKGHWVTYNPHWN